MAQCGDFVSTDDAFIDARTVAVSSQVNDEIADLPVTDNQLVDSGGVLARIDNRDCQAAVAPGKGAGWPSRGKHS